MFLGVGRIIDSNFFKLLFNQKKEKKMNTENKIENTAGTEKKVAPAEKKPNFLQKQWQNVAMLIALIILWLFTGISVWFTILFLVFFWAAATMARKPSNYAFLAKVLKVIFMLGLINLVVIEFFPRLNSTKETKFAMLDQFFAGKPKYTVKTAKDIFEDNRKRASEEFLFYYALLLEQDKTQEALDTLAGFEKKWQFKLDTKKEDDRSGFIRPGQNSLSQGGNQTQSSSQSQPQAQSLAPKDSLFFPGTYFIEIKNGETPFYINIVSSKTCNRYKLASQGGGYFFVNDKNESVYDEPGARVTFPHQEKPRFKLKASKPTIVKMIVS